MCALRSSNRLLTVLFVLAVPALAIAPVALAGESPKKPAAASSRADKADAGDRYDPENIVAISRFMETIAKGTERWVAKDPTGAIDTYKKAVELGPKNPLGHYMLAEAYLASGNTGEAEAAIQQAFEASDVKNPSLRLRVLFVRAEIFDRQNKREEAKAAWQDYALHNDRLDAGGFPQSAAARIKALQRALDLEAAYVGVRERIAAEKADAGKKSAKK